VRIALDRQQLISSPLRVGLSMEATVDVTDQSGKSLSEAPHPTSAVQTEVYAAMDKGATDAVQKIIAANAGSAGSARKSGK
jgi:membrane fusion protein (multidrug efflux system)